MKHTKYFRLFLLLFLSLSGLRSDAQTSVMAWGDNRYGQLGVGTFDTATPFGKASPTAVSGLPAIAGMADGFYHSVAFMTDGTVWTWGYNFYGQLGIGEFDTAAPFGKAAPMQVAGLTGVIAAAAGTHHSLALKSDGTVWAWGWNTSGQLGDGSGVNQNAPVKVGSLANVTAIAAGGVHSLALLADGSVWAWGGNSYGELGTNNTINHLTPVRVASGMVSIACGQYHSLALRNDGGVYGWGSNSNGQLGDGTSVSRLLPSYAPGLSGVGFITCGAFTSLAIKSDGSVWGWGWNGFGQLGDGTTTDRTTPTAVKNLTGAVAIASGQAHTMALKSDGTVWTWGWNASGQTGNGQFATVSPFGILLPQQVNNIAGAVVISGGGNRAHAILSSTPTVSVSGSVLLEGLTLPYTPRTLNLQFRPVSGGARFLRSAALNSDGSFLVSGIPPARYNLWLKGAKWLAALRAIDASGGDVSGVTAELEAGDANNDNSVDTSDFNLFVGSFLEKAGTPNTGYDARVDFNEDGVVDISDFNLLASNFGDAGAY